MICWFGLLVWVDLVISLWLGFLGLVQYCLVLASLVGWWFDLDRWRRLSLAFGLSVTPSGLRYGVGSFMF